MENGWNDEKCKEVFDELMAKYLDKRRVTNGI
jgi:hypothetical protein